MIHTSTSRLIHLFPLLVLVLVLAACTQDDPLSNPDLAEETELEQTPAPAGGADVEPGVGLGTPVPGDLAAVPLPTGADPLTDPATEDGVTVQSWQVSNASPPQVIQFYEERLPDDGWEPGSNDSTGESDPGSIDQAQSTWTRDGRTLLVTVADFDEPDADSVQLSLQLSG